MYPNPLASGDDHGNDLDQMCIAGEVSRVLTGD